jgi:hypothetical protein
MELLEREKYLADLEGWLDSAVRQATPCDLSTIHEHHAQWLRVR